MRMIVTIVSLVLIAGIAAFGLRALIKRPSFQLTGEIITNVETSERIRRPAGKRIAEGAIEQVSIDMRLCLNATAIAITDRHARAFRAQ